MQTKDSWINNPRIWIIRGIVLAVVNFVPLSPSNAQNYTPFEKGFYQTCLPGCVGDKDVVQRIVRHGAKTKSSFSKEEASKRVQDACFNYCSCKLTGVRDAFPSVQQQIAILLQPQNLKNWLEGSRGQSIDRECRKQRLELPFAEVRSFESFCLDRQEIKVSGGGTKLKDTSEFINILNNYYQDLRPRPRDAYARDLISSKAASFMYESVRGGFAQSRYGLPDGRGVKVRFSGMRKDMPFYSIILSIDNIKITGSINQVHRILENKSIGDEIVFCGMKYSLENNQGVWKSQFVAKTNVRVPG